MDCIHLIFSSPHVEPLLFWCTEMCLWLFTLISGTIPINLHNGLAVWAVSIYYCYDLLPLNKFCVSYCSHQTNSVACLALTSVTVCFLALQAGCLSVFTSNCFIELINMHDNIHIGPLINHLWLIVWVYSVR